MTDPNRRAFLQTTTALSAGMALAPMATASAKGANEKVVVGLIGCGGRGPGVAAGFTGLPGVEIAYVCDPDQERRDEAAQKFGVPAARSVDDLRKILDDQSVDAVIVATPDHWHAPAAILACDAGKHVYVEKPCAHNFREGQLLVNAARKNDRVVQHGTQQRSSRFTASAIQMLREGLIGDVLAAKAWNVQRRNNIGHAQPSQPPTALDYDMWIGPAPMVPYQANRGHYNWHWWYDFGTGDMGNDGVHDLDYAVWGLGVETFPSRIVSLGGKYYHDDDQQFPDTQTAVFEYEGDGTVGSRRQLMFEMRLWDTNYPNNCDSGAEFYGTTGRMFLSKRGKLQVWDERNRRIDKPKVKGELPLKVDNHAEDFVDAIRTSRRPNADIEIGFRSTALAHLANIANRLGRAVHFNPEAEAITGDDEAQAMLSRSYRDGGHWAIPTGV